MTFKTPTALAALIVAGAGLSGCVSMSRSSAVDAVPVNWQTEGRVTQVNLTGVVDTAKVGDDFKSIFEAAVKAKVDQCATGSRPLRLDATVSAYSKTNPVVTTVIAGRNRIRGTATLTDTQTGKVVGRYNIGKTIVGGRIAIVKMGPARQQLSEAFGEEVCNQAFPKAAG